MKKLLSLMLIVLFISCNSKEAANKNQVASKEVPPQNQIEISKVDTKSIDDDSYKAFKKETIELLTQNFNDFQIYELSETIKIDLTGDGLNETVSMKIENELGGIIIIDGKSKEETRIGFGLKHREFFDDFSWIDLWATVGKGETYHVLVNETDGVFGSDKVMLENTSLLLYELDPTGGGIITYKNGAYHWIHQSC